MTVPEPRSPDRAVLLLRLAGPLQSWGARGTFNRRDTESEPTCSGILGLLAAARGHERTDPLGKLLDLRLGVRTDVAGRLLRDFHLASDYRGTPLPQSGVNAKGAQRPTSPTKFTHVTNRYYLQDAVFVAGLEGDRAYLTQLQQAVRRPAFPLALGRRSCPPTQPLCLGVHDGNLETVLRTHPWQASPRARDRYREQFAMEGGGNSYCRPPTVPCPVTLDDRLGDEVLNDVPQSFDPLRRSFTSRTVRRDWFDVPTGFSDSDGSTVIDTGRHPAPDGDGSVAAERPTAPAQRQQDGASAAAHDFMDLVDRWPI